MNDFLAWIGLGLLAMAFAGGIFRFFDWLEAFYRAIWPAPEECDHNTLVQDRPGRAHCPGCDRVWALDPPPQTGVVLKQTPGTFS